MESVYAIVVSYNGENYLSRCLDSLTTELLQENIIVVDNNSSDNTVSIIKENYQKVILLLSKENLGFGKGNNLGIRKALMSGAKHIFLINQDAWVEKGTISRLVNLQISDENYGLVSPIHFNDSGTRLGWYFSKMVNADSCPGFINDLYFAKLKSIYEIEFIHASGWLLSSKCLSKAGIFDPIFPHYGEDNDLSRRIKYHGFKIGICSETKLFHKGKFGDKIRSESDQLYHNFIQELVYYKNLKYSFKYILANKIIELIVLIIRAVIFRDFRELGFKLKITYKIIPLIIRLNKARKISRLESAFIS